MYGENYPLSNFNELTQIWRCDKSVDWKVFTVGQQQRHQQIEQKTNKTKSIRCTKLQSSKYQNDKTETSNDVHRVCTGSGISTFKTSV